MSLQKLFLKNSITYKIYVYYNLYIRHKAHKKREFYSQWGEDRFIKDFFKNKSKGFYVDIGSFHPIMYSNTCCLFDIGWSGMNIDFFRINMTIEGKTGTIMNEYVQYVKEQEILFNANTKFRVKSITKKTEMRNGVVNIVLEEI